MFSKHSIIICLITNSLLILLTSNVYGAIWQVGPTRPYTLPSQISTLLSDGDIVEIDAGVYESDVAGWAANNIYIKGIGGKAHIKANGNAYGQKAIWVISGNNYVIENIEFSLCSVPDKNGAGIRLEGQNLTLLHCYFHDNENGILTSSQSTQNLRIEYCEFGHNGYGDGYSHNMYINHIDTLFLRFNYIHNAKIGHEIKSRAKVNFIEYNRITNEQLGTASRCIDIPNGGTSFVIGNIIHQGVNATNNNVLGYGLEGLTNPSAHNLFVINNTIVNQRSICNFFDINTSIQQFKVYNNIFAGNGNFIAGSLPSNIDSSSNAFCNDIGLFAFTDASAFDYRLTSQSIPALDLGINPGSYGFYSLSPLYVYNHPCSNDIRCINGAPDIGAYEFCGNIGVHELPDSSMWEGFIIYPNPVSSELFIRVPNPSDIPLIFFLTDLAGRVVHRAFMPELVNNIYKMDMSPLPAGIFYLYCEGCVKSKPRPVIKL